MKTTQIQLTALTLVFVLIVLGLSSCRSAADKSETSSTAVEPNTTSSLPAKHEAYAAAQSQMGMVTSTTSLGDVYLMITNPPGGSTVRRGTSVDLIAESNRANEIRNVLFYVNGKRVGRPNSSRSPFKVRWWARNRGQFIITVKATKRGGQEVSASSSVTVE